MNRMDPSPETYSEGQRLSGYIVTRNAVLRRTDANVIELRHEPTGARHLHIATTDRNNTFGVTFKTVPRDSTGVAHILEHTVLCGSHRFPVRDPFFSMLKRSLSTFMNAFTAPDATIYPFATQNRKDFYNLMDVYLDAVFHPKLDALSFKQEGHRLEFEGEPVATPDLALQFKGVVYNEMRGAMSSPDQVMVRSILNALYPDTTYRHNSGGDPLEIPDLTYAMLKQFHERHYHPSNAFFFSYGNLPLREHLRFIAETVLNHFDRIDPATDIPSQKRWKQPRQASYFYPLGTAEDGSRKTQACVAWLTADVRESFDVLTLSLLSEILLGTPASPLRKALMDSRLGSALSDGTGYEPDYRDTLFACGLKDIEKKNSDDVEALVLDTLTRLADQGIDRDLVESAIHQLEFHRKEITESPYPYGIQLLMTTFGSWLHGGDPFARLIFEPDLEKIVTAYKSGPFFEGAIRRFFLDNPHRVRLTLSPDPEMEGKIESRIREKLDAMQRKLTPEAMKKIVADSQALLALQESEEPVSVLPTLEIEDIPPGVICVSPANDEGGHPAHYEASTAGIFYLTTAAGISTLTEDILPFIPFFCFALTKMGTHRHDYTQMAKRIQRWAGGIGFSVSARMRHDPAGEGSPFLLLNAKCLNRNQGKLFEILDEILADFNVFDLPRLETLLDEYRAGLEAGVVHNGHRLAMSLASRTFSPISALDEIWHGISQLKIIKELKSTSKGNSLSAVAEKLDAIGKSVFRPGNVRTAFIGDAAALREADDDVAGAPFLSDLNQKGVYADRFATPLIPIRNGTVREGWSTASAVSFVAKTFSAVRMIHEDAPALAVIAKMLRSIYLHREIREKGGAYGGFAVYNPETGLFNMCSYRDPRIVETLDVFDKAATFIRSGDYTKTDVKEAILQVCSEIDRPDPPGPAARKAFVRTLVALSDDARQRFKTQLLGLTRDNLVEAARRYFTAGDASHAVVVISGETQLNTANKRLDPPLTIQRI